MSSTKATNISIQQLNSTLEGLVIGPEDADYDNARALFYQGIDHKPAAIARVANASDVARVVTLAREGGLELAVRSGGHSPAGHSVCDGGLVIDLSAMRKVDIDPAGRSAWAEAGLTAGEYTSAVGEHWLATGFGDTPSVGIGGITLGGGVGYLHRKYGLTADSLLAAEVVTADGELVRTDPEAHPDLFWAIRGGGGNFGVATRFQYRLHDVSEVVAGMLILPATPDLVASFIARAAEAPEELSGMINVMLAPPMPFLPPEHHGKPVLMAMLAYAGPGEGAERTLAPLRGLASPIMDAIRPIRYPEIYEGAEAPQPTFVATEPFFVDSVDTADAEMIFDRLQSGTAPMRVAQLRVLGGAVSRVPADATAFAHRDRRIMMVAAAAYERREDTPEHQAWATDFGAALRQGDPGAYVGFLGDVGVGRVQEAYPGSTWERLREVKRRYDPTNLFRLNQNVPPAD